MSKYGFVYIWLDRKYNRFYIGCHWGLEDDKYICSSNWMRNSYRRRTHDFKRRILARVYTSKFDLLTEEHRWLSMIKSEELGKRYYNLSKRHFGHWTADSKAGSIRKKLKAAWDNPERRQKASSTMRLTMTNIVNTPEFRERKSKHMRALQVKQWADHQHRARMTKISREQLKRQWLDPEFRQTNMKKLKAAHNTEAARKNHSQKSKAMWADPELRKKLLEAGHTETAKEKRSRGLKTKWADPEFKEQMSQKYKALWKNPEYRTKMSLRRGPNRDPISGQFTSP